MLNPLDYFQFFSIINMIAMSIAIQVLFLPTLWAMAFSYFFFFFFINKLYL